MRPSGALPLGLARNAWPFFVSEAPFWRDDTSQKADERAEISTCRCEKNQIDITFFSPSVLFDAKILFRRS
jgi:putative NADH-flavin reductase